ncbi:DUF2345 domain-containing protein, partial [Stenotrophomonas sp.]|uniref:DUF2345 domain-containing protein n=1 Tax=Stenotrophomonas sp. TaxID=69392 RepID=UPI0028AFBFED
AYIRIEGDNIELGAPGKVQFKASQRDWVGPASVAGGLAVPSADLKACPTKDSELATAGAAVI